ncbi:MAG TPA: FAD-binding protein, partial [Longimicrobiales bacterium]|nr:FAD-binding protein [Longimicrobiales bacterium]
REGGHSRRRILHAGDLTGREIERALLDAVAEHPRIRMVEDLQAVDLLVGVDADGARRCTGALLLEHRTGQLMEFDAGMVLLATGGLGQAYRHTTNPEIATGDGVAMAYRAGVRIANLEFVQFHPTALYPAQERAFLISEAVRGEGAVLRRLDGSALMEGVHPLASLAPRDIVARTIDLDLKATGAPHVLLDLSPIASGDIETRFPGILAECAERGIDIRSEPIPVVPAAHYSCGGVLTDAWGSTSLPGLHAAGEVACTGVHGANRLASNSLLEAVVYSHRAAQHVERELARATAFGGVRVPGPGAASAAGRGSQAGANGDPEEIRSRLRDLMWEDAGIARTTARLEEAADELERLRVASSALYDAGADTATVDLRNLVEVAALIVECARQRQESRGLHWNLDFPHRDNERFLCDTIVSRGEPRGDS